MNLFLVYSYLALVGLSGLAIAASIWVIVQTARALWREL